MPPAAASSSGLLSARETRSKRTVKLCSIQEERQAAASCLTEDPWKVRLHTSSNNTLYRSIMGQLRFPIKSIRGFQTRKINGGGSLLLMKKQQAARHHVLPLPRALTRCNAVVHEWLRA